MFIGHSINRFTMTEGKKKTFTYLQCWWPFHSYTCSYSGNQAERAAPIWDMFLFQRERGKIAETIISPKESTWI